MITKTQQLKQCLASSAKLRSWLELAGVSGKQVEFLEDLEVSLTKAIEKEAA